MTTLKTLRDVLIDELRDLYSAETQLVKALPKMQKKATNESLKAAISSHLEETNEHVARLEKIGTMMSERLTGKVCRAMQGLLEEGSEVLEQTSENPALVDALMIGCAQRIEHYEMAAYGTARAMAEALGEGDIASMLDETLDEEGAADHKLTAISEEEVLPDATEPSDDSDVSTLSGQTSRRGSSSQASRSRGAHRAAAIAVTFAAGLLASGQAIAAPQVNQPSRERDAAQYDVDNTGRNERDRNESRRTADDQNMDRSDTDVLAQIRREVVANDNMSTYGKNVKIVVGDGTVTLRGPVRTAEEKSWIGQVASKVANGYRVDNQLEVKSAG